ncbi:hypothetical protein P280DRAFT_240820 [Massarina eburnea CBS 473.64]|uniref:Uncharacterized protein n=1 Tax=Massarina eburnea CBS 473.64 TaxID=1395130 RepID=A0A6A6S6W0_9PLEO|nr:hypothetical protein P280DRAFT_240820 [Massarina eburnea CBS 473.64]
MAAAALELSNERDSTFGMPVPKRYLQPVPLIAMAASQHIISAKPGSLLTAWMTAIRGPLTLSRLLEYAHGLPCHTTMYPYYCSNSAIREKHGRVRTTYISDLSPLCWLAHHWLACRFVILTAPFQIDPPTHTPHPLSVGRPLLYSGTPSPVHLEDQRSRYTTTRHTARHLLRASKT